MIAYNQIDAELRLELSGGAKIFEQDQETCI